MAPRVLGIVLRSLIDRAQSEEVTQDIFLEIWQTASRYDPARGNAVSWIMTMAHRRAIDRVRASQSSRNRDYSVGMRDRPIDYDVVIEEVEVNSDYRRAVVALDRLTALQREVIDLVYVQGFSQREAADVVGVTINTVKTRLRDGLIRMRTELTA